MSLKDNFNQAVKELLKKDGLVADKTPAKNSKQKSELDRYIDKQNESAMPIQDNAFDSDDSATDDDLPSLIEPISTPPPINQPTPSQPSQMSPSPINTPKENLGAWPNVQPQVPISNSPVARPIQQPETPYYDTEEITLISRNTIIDGNIRSFANVNIEGSVKGDIQITKNINISGKVVGDMECNNAVMHGSSMQGSVTSKGQVTLDRDSLILGDISAQYLDLNGKVKGNVEIGGKAEFKTDAIIFGNINASTISVVDGATIQGFVNTTFLQESASNVFPEAIAVSE